MLRKCSQSVGMSQGSPPDSKPIPPSSSAANIWWIGVTQPIDVEEWCGGFIIALPDMIWKCHSNYPDAIPSIYYMAYDGKWSRTNGYLVTTGCFLSSDVKRQRTGILLPTRKHVNFVLKVPGLAPLQRATLELMWRSKTRLVRDIIYTVFARYLLPRDLSQRMDKSTKLTWESSVFSGKTTFWEEGKIGWKTTPVLRQSNRIN